MIILFLAAALSVTDGDTIRLDDERVRLIGVDAPEIHRAECLKERLRGQMARIALTLMLDGRTIVLQRDGKDRYGRTLAIVFADGVDVNAAMIDTHHAVKWTGRKHDWCAD